MKDKSRLTGSSGGRLQRATSGPEPSPVSVVFRSGCDLGPVGEQVEERADPEEIAYYACYGPRRSSTADLAWIAGSRWHIEVGHHWHRSRRVGLSWLSFLLRPVTLRFGWCPAGAGVVAGRALPALA